MAVLKAGEVLLIRRGDNGLWDIPGGGRRWWETPARAARRELAEETGLSVGALHPLGVFQHRHTYLDGNTVDWETHVFTSEYAGARRGPATTPMRRAGGRRTHCRKPFQMRQPATSRH
ncbi:NUDIX domain-containing protein [Deinococcus radiopugnans]|uniref:NUDIX domain-containing protein n=1 Tax=Deinococcus radiopugnans TaxID=57497 RepID=UPI00361DEA32